MHTSQIVSVLAATGSGLVAARPVPAAYRTIVRREVPQEHSHEKFLTSVRTNLLLDNPGGFVDPVFALLGNAAAVQGANGADPDCLQQLIADQAFTNAKAAGDVQGMVDALIYRTLERNTGKVGQASVQCTAVQAVNPEIAALQQHQDPASNGAAALNKQIALDLAVQIASVGGDPQQAVESGTFAPGDVNDNTGAGNSCDDQDDPEGCIFTQNLLVPDVTPEEIDAAVAADGGAGGNNAAANANNGNGAANNDNVDCEATATVTVTVTAGIDTGSAAATTTAAAAAGQATPAAGGAGTSIAEAAQLAADPSIDLGNCPNIALAFGQNIEGRKETSFIMANLDQFNHGSAQNPNIITEFACNNLVNNCGLKRGDAAVDLCDQAAQAVANLPRDGSTADAFNQFFGITTNFAPIPVVDNQGNTVGAGAAGNAAVAVPTAAANTGNQNNNNSGDANVNAGSDNGGNNGNSGNNVAANGAGANNVAAGGNLQKFTGALGGATADAVTVGGRGFVVEGSDDFLNLAAALGRSCDRQKNACANLANSGASFSVGDCDAQAGDCRALI